MSEKISIEFIQALVDGKKQLPEDADPVAAFILKRIQQVEAEGNAMIPEIKKAETALKQRQQQLMQLQGLMHGYVADLQSLLGKVA